MDGLLWSVILELVATVVVCLLAWTMGGISALSGLGEAKHSRTGGWPSSRKSLVGFAGVIFFFLMLISTAVFMSTRAPIAQAHSTPSPTVDAIRTYPTVTPRYIVKIPPSPIPPLTDTPSPLPPTVRPPAEATAVSASIMPSSQPSPTPPLEATRRPAPSPTPLCAGASLFISAPLPGTTLSRGSDVHVEGVVCSDQQNYVAYTVEIHRGHSLSDNETTGWLTLEDRFNLQREIDFTIANPGDLVPGEKASRNGCTRIPEVLLQNSRVIYGSGPYTLRLKAFEGTWQGNKYTKNGQSQILSSRCWVEFTIMQ